VTEKKAKKPATPAKQEPKPTPPAEAAPAVPAPAKPTVLGPGVVKRPKRDPNVPVKQTDGEVTYLPSDQVFRRR